MEKFEAALYLGKIWEVSSKYYVDLLFVKVSIVLQRNYENSYWDFELIYGNWKYFGENCEKRLRKANLKIWQKCRKNFKNFGL